MRTIIVNAIVELELEVDEYQSMAVSENTVEEATNWCHTKVVKVLEAYPKVKEAD